MTNIPANERRCPPCNRGCDEGRQCPADREPLSAAEAWAVVGIVLAPWLALMLVLWAWRTWL